MPYYFGAPWLPTFTGSARASDASSFKDFKDKMRSMFKLYPLREEQKVEIVIGQLKGPALREVRAWAEKERKTAEDIFRKLGSILDARTISELRSRLYSRKQQPQESLREFALALQEAMRAVQDRESRGIEEVDETLTNLFIEGARGEATRAQLRMWKRQNPVCSFSEFKEAVLDILRLNQIDAIETDTVGTENELLTDVITKTTPETLISKGVVTQHIQSSQDPIEALTSAVADMMKEIKEIREEQAEARRESWRPKETVRGGTPPEAWEGDPQTASIHKEDPSVEDTTKADMWNECQSGALNARTPR